MRLLWFVTAHPCYGFGILRFFNRISRPISIESTEISQCLHSSRPGRVATLYPEPALDYIQLLQEKQMTAIATNHSAIVGLAMSYGRGGSSVLTNTADTDSSDSVDSDNTDNTATTTVKRANSALVAG